MGFFHHRHSSHDALLNLNQPRHEFGLLLLFVNIEVFHIDLIKC